MRFCHGSKQYHPTWYTAGPTLHQAILPLIESRPDVLGAFPATLRPIHRCLAAASVAAAVGALLTCSGPRGLRHDGSWRNHRATRCLRPNPETRIGRLRSTGSEIGIMGENGELLPRDCEGEIVVRGAAVIQSYRNNPEADLERFPGRLVTGPEIWGCLDPDGFLFVTGRIKEIINRGGEKILPGEKSKKHCWRILRSGKPWRSAPAHATRFLGEDVMAAVVLRPGFSANEFELRRFAAQKIADFKLPRRIVFLDAIPKNATGKPERIALAAQLQEELKALPKPAPASTEVEKKLAEIWSRIFAIETVGTQEDFLPAGRRLASIDAHDWRTSISSSARMITRSSCRVRTSRRWPGSWCVRPPSGAMRLPLWRSSRTARAFRFFCIPGVDENSVLFSRSGQGASLGQDSTSSWWCAIRGRWWTGECTRCRNIAAHFRTAIRARPCVPRVRIF